MTNFQLYFAALVILAVAIYVVTKSSARRMAYPYCSRKYLLTKAERSFLGVVDSILDDRYRIFSKVRMADVIKVRSGLKASKRQAAFNRIQAKHLDFVICSANDLSIVGAIELDDKSHDRLTRRARDQFVDQAFLAAGIPILHCPARASYSVSDLKRTIYQEFEMGLPEDDAVTGGIQEIFEDVGPVETEHSQPFEKMDFGKCPACGARLVKKIIGEGPHAGKAILKCSKFPKCKYVQPYKEREDALTTEINDRPFVMSEEPQPDDDSRWAPSGYFKM